VQCCSPIFIAWDFIFASCASAVNARMSRLQRSLEVFPEKTFGGSGINTGEHDELDRLVLVFGIECDRVKSVVEVLCVCCW